MKIQDFIARISLFEGLPREQVEALSGSRSPVTSEGNDDLCRGRGGDGLLCPHPGEVNIFKLSPERREQILHIFQPGDPFGEVPVFSGENYPAFAKTLTESEAIFN